MDFIIDLLAPADWGQVCAIYLEGISTGQATFEAAVPTWAEWDADHLPSHRLAARANGQVIGWAALSPVSRRSCYAGVAEVSLYVRTAYRGQGVGKALLQAIISESEKHGIWTLQGSTFPENTVSLRLQESCGSRVLGRRERIACHHGTWRDTLLTERRSPVVGLE